MPMLIRLLLALIVSVSLAGCASYPDVSRQRMESLSQHYNHFDAALSWDVRRAGPGIGVDGYIKNLRYLPMEDVEVWVTALDPSGKTITRSVGYVIPHALQQDEIAPFSVKLPATSAPVERLRFTYKYRIGQGGDSEGGGDAGSWMQSFDAALPALP